MGIMTICNIAKKDLQFLQDANGVRRSRHRSIGIPKQECDLEYMLLCERSSVRRSPSQTKRLM
jgi:hypothetical protein